MTTDGSAEHLFPSVNPEGQGKDAKQSAEKRLAYTSAQVGKLEAQSQNIGVRLSETVTKQLNSFLGVSDSVTHLRKFFGGMGFTNDRLSSYEEVRAPNTGIRVWLADNDINCTVTITPSSARAIHFQEHGTASSLLSPPFSNENFDRMETVQLWLDSIRSLRRLERQALDRVSSLNDATNRQITAQEKEIKNLTFIQRNSARISGNLARMEKSLKADREYQGRLMKASNELRIYYVAPNHSSNPALRSARIERFLDSLSR